MEETHKEIEILGVTETHLNNNISDEELLISGYRVECKDRENGPCGGTAVYIRDDIQWQRRNDLEVNRIECLWIELLINGQDQSYWVSSDPRTHQNILIKILKQNVKIC